MDSGSSKATSPSSNSANDAFLLAPPPPPRSLKRRVPSSPATPRKQSSPVSPRQHASPHRIRSSATRVKTPRTPLASFINLLDAPSAASAQDLYPLSPSPFQSAEPNLVPGLGYSSVFRQAHNPTICLPTTPKTPTNPIRSPTRSPSFVKKLKSRARSIPSLRRRNPTSPRIINMPSVASSSTTVGMSRTRSRAGTVSSSKPSTSRGSSSSSKGNVTPKATLSSFASSIVSRTRPDTKAASAPRDARKRYPLPPCYAEAVQIDLFFGDTRTASGKAPLHAGKAARPEQIGYGAELAYFDDNGQIWRDREERAEYQGLLSEPSFSENGAPFGEGGRAWSVFERKSSADSTATARVGDRMDDVYEDEDVGTVVVPRAAGMVSPRIAPGRLNTPTMTSTSGSSGRKVPLLEPQPGHELLRTKSRRRPAPLPLQQLSRNQNVDGQEQHLQPREKSGFFVAPIVNVVPAPELTIAGREEFFAASFNPPEQPRRAQHHAISRSGSNNPTPRPSMDREQERVTRSKPPVSGTPAGSSIRTHRRSSSSSGMMTWLSKSNASSTTSLALSAHLATGSSPDSGRAVQKKSSFRSVADLFKKSKKP
ncbi:hypothetical protein BOTBODRAFT_245532 [Botryobasidium botryosum FD-172 SS1]|uniref:Uncharacterized protein n=1 Tax=Botryobasidium botryosum (strain FD-172 SS1) TaxID=930990 RepID=A0A067LWH9_BOTB1|nr:hypothetical protein BOTBODRAFT_245532 [Botryobasidium botryosum FD-172 SS1]